MKKFYYIALRNGQTCEGIVRSESIDSARGELLRKGLEEINLAILRSDSADFIDLENPTEEGVSL